MTRDAGPVPAVDRWHQVVRTRDTELLRSLLADEVVFRSPAVHSPQMGPAKAHAYLLAAIDVLGPSLVYHRHWYGADSAVLEFVADIDGLEAHGVDILRWNERDLLVEFTVMVRPLRALQRLVELMGERLQRVSGPVEPA